MDQKSSFFICPRVSARFLHCFCTVSRDAMGTLTCKIRQRMQKLHSEKSRCFAQKQRKLETFKIRVTCPVGSFNQRARDSSSLERTKNPRRIARFVVGFSIFWGSAHFLHTGGKAVSFLALSAFETNGVGISAPENRCHRCSLPQTAANQSSKLCLLTRMLVPRRITLKSFVVLHRLYAAQLEIANCWAISSTR